MQLADLWPGGDGPTDIAGAVGDVDGRESAAGGQLVAG